MYGQVILENKGDVFDGLRDLIYISREKRLQIITITKLEL